MSELYSPEKTLLVHEGQQGIPDIYKQIWD